MKSEILSNGKYSFCFTGLFSSALYPTVLIIEAVIECDRHTGPIFMKAYLHESPDAKMWAVLSKGHATISYLQHIWVWEKQRFNNNIWQTLFLKKNWKHNYHSNHQVQHMTPTCYSYQQCLSCLFHQIHIYKSVWDHINITNLMSLSLSRKENVTFSMYLLCHPLYANYCQLFQPTMQDHTHP